MTIKKFACDVDPNKDFLEIDSTFRDEPNGMKPKMYIEITNDTVDEYALVGLDREKAQEVAEHILSELGINVKQLQSRLDEAEGLLSDAEDLLDNIHGYDTDTYRDIQAFLNGDDE